MDSKTRKDKRDEGRRGRVTRRKEKERTEGQVRKLMKEEGRR